MCCVLCSAIPIGPQVEQIIAKFSGVSALGLECYSNNLDPLLRGQTEWLGVAG